ncbi:DUF4286 family protein [Chloroflexota bacterium]
MAKWVLVVETNCADAAREVEFTEWYNKTHIPDIFETPAIVRATRYENIKPEEGKGKFLAICEIETDNIEAFMKTHQDNMAKKRTEGRYSELLVRTSRGFYKQLISVTR